MGRQPPQAPAHPELLQDPFAAWLAVDVGGLAADLLGRPEGLADDLVDATAAPEFEEGEISQAFDCIQQEPTVPRVRRVRVCTDNTWAMEERA